MAIARDFDFANYDMLYRTLLVDVKLLHTEAKLPAYAKHGDAGLDLYAVGEWKIPPGERVIIPTGVAVAIPEGYVGLVWDRSGNAATYGLTILGGVIDSGYRGEIFAVTFNTRTDWHTVHHHDRIAQLLVQAVPNVVLRPVDTLPPSERGDAKFGSTGS